MRWEVGYGDDVPSHQGSVEEDAGPHSREAIRRSVESRFPRRWQPGTLNAHLYACAINNPKAYVHHPSSERLLYKRADGTFELYDEKEHGPNQWAPDRAEDGSEQAVEASMASSGTSKISSCTDWTPLKKV